MHVLDKVESTVTGACHPKFDVDVICRLLWQIEFCHYHHLAQFFRRGSFQPSRKNVAVGPWYDHWGNPNSTPGAIVAHSDLSKRLRCIIHDDPNGHSNPLHVSHLLNEWTTSSISKVERSNVCWSFNFDSVVERVFITPEYVVWIIVHFAHDWTSVWYRSKVCIRSRNHTILCKKWKNYVQNLPVNLEARLPGESTFRVAFIPPIKTAVTKSIVLIWN